MRTALLIVFCVLAPATAAQAQSRIESPERAWERTQIEALNKPMPKLSDEEKEIRRDARLIVQKSPNKGRTPEARAKIAKQLATQATARVKKAKDSREREVWSHVAAMYRNSGASPQTRAPRK